MESVTLRQAHALGLLCAVSLGSTAALAQGTSPATVILSLAEPSPVIGVTGETELRIEVMDPPESPMPLPTIYSSAGQVEDLSREGPATFTARYILPSSRFPQPAILVAEFAQPMWPLRGMTTIRLRAATTQALVTDPRSQVTLRVGEHEFGPQMAPADGTVRIPIVVPPGVEFAIARSVSPYGKATEQVVDLHVPYSQRVLVAAPPTIAAGSTAEIAVYAVEPSGQTADASTITLKAAGVRITPLGSRTAGEARFLIAAPGILRDTSVRFEAMLAGQSTTRTGTRIALVPAQAAGLTLLPEAPEFGRTQNLRVFMAAQDAFGNTVDAGRAGVLVDGIPATVGRSRDGQPVIVLKAPPPTAGRTDVVVEGTLDSAHATLRVPLRSGTGGARAGRPETTLAPRSLPTPRATLMPCLGAFTNFRGGAGSTFLVEGVIHRSTRDPWLGLGLSVGLFQSFFAAESPGAISHASLSAVPILFQVRQRYHVAERLLLGLGAGGGLAVAFVRVQTFGQQSVGSSYGGAGEAMAEASFLLDHAHLVVSVRYLWLYFARFTSGDSLVGNAGGAVADLGYRLVW